MGEHTHKEAFCLMWYACKSCGHRERIWNSRDGVTPFGCSCPSCSAGIMNHVNWRDDACVPEMTTFGGGRLAHLLLASSAEADAPVCSCEAAQICAGDG